MPFVDAPIKSGPGALWDRSKRLESDDFACAGGVFRRIGAIQWLIFCGVGIVLAITFATAFLVLQFRDRTMEAAEHELANTAQVLSRHFDQQLDVLQRIHDEVQNYARDEGIDTPEAFESACPRVACMRCCGPNCRHFRMSVH